MKLPISPHSNKKIFVISIFVLLVIVGIATYGYRNLRPNSSNNQSSNSGSQEVNYGPPTQSEKDAGQKAKEQTINESGSGKPVAPGTDSNQSNGSDGSTVNVTITAVNQNDQTLSIRSLIEEVTTTGSCTLTLTKGSVVVVKKSNTQALANSSTCKGFDIPTSELSPGTWNINLSVSTTNKSGSASKSVVIN